MTESNVGKFSCASCGRTFRWKPEIAGKKGKCSCGTTLMAPVTMAIAEPPPAPPGKPKIAIKPTIVPTIVPKIAAPTKPAAPKPPAPKPPPPPTPETQNTDEGDGTYDLAGLIPSEAAIAAASREFVVPAVAVPAAPTEVLDYQRAPKPGRSRKDSRIDLTTGELADPMRNYIVPLIFFSAGLLLLGAYVARGAGTGPLAELAFGVAAVAMFVWALLETGVMILVAFPIATYCDVSLGLLRTAVLKFAAVVIFSETLLMWIQLLLARSGVIPRRMGFEELFIWWFLFFVMLVIIFHGCFWYVFRIPAVEVKFAALMAIMTRICNFFLLLVILGLAVSYAANHVPTIPGTNGVTFQSVPARQIPPPIFNVPPPVASGAAPSTQPSNSPTQADAMISWIIHNPRSGVMEGYAWAREVRASDAAKKVISQMYDAGALKVYVDGVTMFVLLPNDDAGKRAACLEVSRTYRRDMGLGDTPADMSQNYQYIVLSLAPAQFQRRR